MKLDITVQTHAISFQGIQCYHLLSHNSDLDKMFCNAVTSLILLMTISVTTGKVYQKKTITNGKSAKFTQFGLAIKRAQTQSMFGFFSYVNDCTVSSVLHHRKQSLTPYLLTCTLVFLAHIYDCNYADLQSLFTKKKTTTTKLNIISVYVYNP